MSNYPDFHYEGKQARCNRCGEIMAPSALHYCSATKEAYWSASPVPIPDYGGYVKTYFAHSELPTTEIIDLRPRDTKIIERLDRVVELLTELVNVLIEDIERT